MIPFLATHVPRFTARFFPDLLFRVSTLEKVAYLTFDDGPTATLTSRLLHLLDRYQARATFFLIGAHARQHPLLVRDLHDAGHTIGNHTFTHPDAWKTDSRRVLQELDRTTRLLEDQLAQPIRWMRPPYGRFTRSMRHWCRAHQQLLTLWDVMPGDYLPGASTARVQRYLTAYIRPGSVVVLHDNPKAASSMPVALEHVLERFSGEGWRFDNLGSIAI